MIGIGVDGFLALNGIPTAGLGNKLLGVASNFVDNVKDGISSDEIEKVRDTAKSKGLLKPAEVQTPPKEIEAFRKLYAQILNALGKTLIVFIDNLDRCLPQNSIHTLEAIRLFLFLPNSAFVVATDEEMIMGAVSEYYRNTSEQHIRDYLDKLIQVPIHVPKVGIREIRAYLIRLLAQKRSFSSETIKALGNAINISLQEAWNRDVITKKEIQTITDSEDKDFADDISLADRISPLLAKSPKIKGNPRIVKRLLNIIKMRYKIAERRKMPLDESIITKFVIFERCASEAAVNSLYNLINSSEEGKPAIFNKISFDNIPEDAPKEWKKENDTFFLEWLNMEPSLADYDLRAVAYLSRETMPLSITAHNLSKEAKETLNVLLSIENINSTIANEMISKCPIVEYEAVMEKLIDQLRKTTDWTKSVVGYHGAHLLANNSIDAGRLLKRFIDKKTDKKPWLKMFLKKATWYKEEI